MKPHSKQRGLLDLRFLISLGALLIIILFLAYFFYGLQPNVTVAAGESSQFRIVKGDGLKLISARLSEQSLIKSITVFKFYTLLSGRAQQFQPGIYELAPNMSIPQMVDVLTSSGKNEVTVVLQEGVTVSDFDKILSEAGVIEKKALLNYPIEKSSVDYKFLNNVSSLEGFLFPDTYRFHLDSSPEDVVLRLLENFKTKAWPFLESRENWYDLLILASFLEREVPDFNDRQIVAGILLKRLQKKMPLQVDATISYAKCGAELTDCKELIVTKKDLSLPSPYNTYQRLGFTPTPISNPGQSAVKAAVTPQASPYWYYLSELKTKETVFSKTLEEHNLNRVKFL